MPRFRFIGWYNSEKTLALIEDTETGVALPVPRLRLIPHPRTEEELRASGISNPNQLAELAAEANSLFAIPIHRWFQKKKWTPQPLGPEDLEEAVPFPENTDFSCIRDCVLEGRKQYALCVEECSQPLRTRAVALAT